MTRAVGIIPARWASTRFPGKPLHPIAGKPLLQHVWERCRRAKTLDSVIIATDDMRIARAAFDWGADVALTSSRHKSGTDRIAEVVRHAKQFGIVVNIQGDEPLIEPQLIDRLVNKLRANPEIDMITAGHPFAKRTDMNSPHQVKVFVDRNGRALDFSRKAPRSGALQSADLHKRRSRDRHSLKPKILRHQGIYAFRRAALLRFVKWKQTRREKAERLEQLRAVENGVTVHVLVTKHGSPGVDTPQDVKNVAQKLARTKTVAAAVSAAKSRKSQAARLPLQR